MFKDDYFFGIIALFSIGRICSSTSIGIYRPYIFIVCLLWILLMKFYKLFPTFIVVILPRIKTRFRKCPFFTFSIYIPNGIKQWFTFFFQIRIFKDFNMI